VLGDALIDLSRSFGFFFSSEGLAETPPPPPRVFFGDVSKLARLERPKNYESLVARGRRRRRRLFSRSQMLEDDDDHHPYKNAGR